MANRTSIDVETVLGALTLEEKVALCLGGDMWHTASVERLSVPSIMVADGPHGLRVQLGEAGDHAGIGGSEPATCFPTASAIASSWDPELVEGVGTALAIEARALGVAVVLGPGINIKRSPLCGRNFEYISEDPWLAGELATAMVRGLQEHGVGASLKHFAANNQENDRLRVSAEVDERTLREIYLPAFERVVTEAAPWTVMCAYNRINGTHASQHHWLLTELLRDAWGYDGLVVSDWGSVHDRAAALRAGLDLEMPPAHGISDVEVLAAVDDDSLDVTVLDAAVRNVLRLVARHQEALATELPPPDLDAHHALARRAATRSAVLLRNEGAALPLRPAAGETVSVLGAFATRPRFQGAGSSQVNPTRVDVPADELRALLSDDVTVRTAEGYAIDGPAIAPDDPAAVVRRDEAVAAAVGAEHVVLFLGLPSSAESEGFDRTHIQLPADQLALVAAVTAVHDRVVVVLVNGSAVQVTPWVQDTAAVLECWLGGQAGGGAIADLLLGRATPSGKLAETIPLRLEDSPSYLTFPGEHGVVRYGEGVFVGYRGHDALGQDVAFPFGFGLSYTTFDVTDVTAEVHGSIATDDLTVVVTATVANTGAAAGAEVVQVYVGDPEATVARPPRELRGAVRVELDPDATATVSVELPGRALAYWSTQHDDWVVEPGTFRIEVGTSSRHIAASIPIEVEGPSVAPPLDAWSTAHEWFADPAGRAVLDREAPAGILDDEELLQMMGTFPMRSLAGFATSGFDREDLARWLDEVHGR